MAIPTNHYQAAFAKYRQGLAAAVNFTDGDLTHTAQTRRRHQGVMEARRDLYKVIPAAPTLPTTTRATVIGGLAPRTADAVAVQAREFGIVERLLAKGQPIEAIIRDASPERLAAIASNAEVLPRVLESGEGAKVIEGVHDQVFDRLLALGDPAAENVSAMEAIYGTQAAWHQFLTESLEGTAGIDARMALYNADPEGYQAVVGSEAAGGVAPSDIDTKVSSLDRTMGVGSAKAGV
ncbi:hypothetical protein MRBLWH7_000334 [Microbacterium sp. LWH7-1.2]|uniref:hypothetical protein n=1 Tax=Microbacterium sp. LWH7-1.2 TaxID=3135257 RepID=UPI0031392973